MAHFSVSHASGCDVEVEATVTVRPEVSLKKWDVLDERVCLV